jgi:hypothetical protein
MHCSPQEPRLLKHLLYMGSLIYYVSHQNNMSPEYKLFCYNKETTETCNDQMVTPGSEPRHNHMSHVGTSKNNTCPKLTLAYNSRCKRC